jgi:hypothetical protein
MGAPRALVKRSFDRKLLRPGPVGLKTRNRIESRTGLSYAL